MYKSLKENPWKVERASEAIVRMVLGTAIKIEIKKKKSRVAFFLL